MPNATVRANARALPEISSRRASPAKADVAPPFGARAETVSIAGEYDLLAARRRYSVAYSKWLIACARLSDELSDDDQVVEEKLDAKKEFAAEFLAIRAP